MVQRKKNERLKVVLWILIILILSGGINQASTKTELGTNAKTVYWTDSENVEIYNNRGIIRQKGNTLFLELPEQEPIIGMHEMESDSSFKLIIVTASGKIYIYREDSNSLTLLDKTLTGSNIKFYKLLTRYCCSHRI